MPLKAGSCAGGGFFGITGLVGNGQRKLSTEPGFRFLNAIIFINDDPPGGLHHPRHQSCRHAIAPFTLRFAEQINPSCTFRPGLDPGSNSGKALVICFFAQAS